MSQLESTTTHVLGTDPASGQEPNRGYAIGDLVHLTCESPAHGGAFVARSDKGVVFVRHALSGESVQARITAIGPKNRYYFADAVAVDRPSPARRTHPWVQANSLLTEEERATTTGVRELLGGMEYGHIDPATQRIYKTDILRSQLVRLGGIDPDSPLLTSLVVEPMPTKDLTEGDLSWRSRVRYPVVKTPAGWRIGMYPHRSSRAVPVIGFPLAARELRDLNLHQLNLRGIRQVDAAVSSRGRILLQLTVDRHFSVGKVSEPIARQAEQLWGDLAKRKISLLFTPESHSAMKSHESGARPSLRSPYRRVRAGDVLIGGGLKSVTEDVVFGSRRFSYQVSAGGFWQIHRCAPSTLVGAMLSMLRPAEGECTLDLYAGAGLFTAALADAVGGRGTVVSVEGSPVTHRDARANFAPDGLARSDSARNTRVEVLKGEVSHTLLDLKTALELNEIPHIDAVVLDPSREGAGRRTLERLNDLSPGRILYVACDPAALGRDTAILRELGWDLVQVRGYDMYPNTHHLEAVALFYRAPARIKPRRIR